MIKKDKKKEIEKIKKQFSQGKGGKYKQKKVNVIKPKKEKKKQINRRS